MSKRWGTFIERQGHHMESFMTKKNDLNSDIMSEISEEEIRMTGIYDTHHYNYRCRDCGYEVKVEDIVVDSFPPSPRSKHRMPELQCFCGGDLCYVKDL